MKPESEWFRPPTWQTNLPRNGDWESFVWIAEPEMGKGIFGVYYEVSAELLIVTPPSTLERLKEAALGELRRRVEAGDSHGEGEIFEVFRWNPIVVRTMSGRMSIRTDKEYVINDPVLSTSEPLKGMAPPGLFARPGRCFTVRGDHDDNQVGPRS